MPRIHPDEDELVFACPECDEAGCVYMRTGTNTHAGDPDDPYICQKCAATFKDPIKREKKDMGQKASVGGRSESMNLEDLNPEDLGLSPLRDDSE